jgi:hypothetical protein
VRTNWGIAILEVPFTLQPGEIRTVNLRDWFQNGGDLQKALATPELKHLAAAAGGRPSPKDGLYYSTPVRAGLAVGSVTLRTRGARPDALWGDWFLVDARGNLASGDTLVDVDRSARGPDLCQRHLLRYLSGGGFDGGTEVIVWREAAGAPSPDPDGGPRLPAVATSFSEPGRRQEDRQLSLLPVDKVTVAELGLKEPFGALDVQSDAETFVGVRHTAESRYSVGLQAHCLPREDASQSPCEEQAALAVDVLLNGQPAGAPRGPLVPSGSQLSWSFVITNTGQVLLSEIRLEGIAASCPRSELEMGEAMECTASGTALSGLQSVPVTVSGTGSCSSASTSVIGYYEGELEDVYTLPFLGIVTLVNGQDANEPPGPSILVGSPVTWTYVVTNLGDADLFGVQVGDDQGVAVSCPKTALLKGESMTCTGSGTAEAGQHAHLGTAQGAAITGETASASDPSHYLGVSP